MKTTFDACAAPLGEVIEQLSTSVETGLSQHVAAEMRKVEGPNTSASRFGFFPPLLVAVYAVPVLSVAAVLGQAGDMVSACIVASTALIMSVGLYALVHRVLMVQARRGRLRQSMERASVTVVREGVVQTLSGRQLLPGDIVMYDKAANVTLPADCRVMPGHDLRVQHSWQFGWLDGTRLSEETHCVLAGTQFQVATGTLVVVATGNKRKIAEMHADHPAGPFVRSIWQAGLWYLLATAILLGSAALQGSLVKVAYALAIATPVLLPFFFIKKGRGLRTQTVNTIPDHLLYPIEQLLKPKPKDALIMLKDTVLPLREIKKAPEEMRNTMTQFLELLGLCVRDDTMTRHGKLLLRLVTDARRQGMTVDTMENWSLDLDSSKIVFHPATGTYGYTTSFVMRDDEQENTLHLACNDALQVLGKCTYLWDGREHTMRRRFFSGEKQQMADMLQAQHDEGSIAYGLALRENAHEDAPWIYIGAVVIPREVETETLQELHTYASNNHAVVFYAESALSPSFAKEKLRIPAKHVFTEPGDISFNNLRRNDFFLASGIDAIQLRHLQDQLVGSVLVDTLQDRFVSSLYFWPRHMRFDSSSTPSFFSWLTRQSRQASDGLTKGAQYLGLVQITTLVALALLFISPGTPQDKVFLFSASTVTIFGLLALLAHVLDKNAQPKNLHRLAFLDIQQAITGARNALGVLVAAGIYLLLVRESIQREALPLELLFFVLAGIGAGTLSRYAEDTPSMLVAGLYALFYALLTGLAYLFLFASATLLPMDFQWLLLAAVILGGVTWILASYQGLPQRRL